MGKHEHVYLLEKLIQKERKRSLYTKKKELTKINYLAFLAFLVTIIYHTLP